MANPRTDTGVTADISVSASFAVNQYTVSFDSQGGSAVSSITQDFASSVTVPGAPTRTGYTFGNWNTVADGTGTAYAPAATFAMPANNSTLYAIWTINQYTVSFDSQGGSAVSSITQDYATHRHRARRTDAHRLHLRQLEHRRRWQRYCLCTGRDVLDASREQHAVRDLDDQSVHRELR